MCDLQFCHLHGHTKFSIGDSTTDPYQIAKKALENGMKAFAITDHGIASSWIQAAKAAKQVTEEARAKEIKRRQELGLPIDEEEINQIGVKFIPGIEIYETEDRLIKSKNEMKEKGYGHYHLLLLPKNNEGLINLNKIITDASLNGLFDRRNRTDLRVIKENGWGKHIIATSACLASRLSKTILSGDYEKAKQLALEYASVFEEFYLELQDNGIKDQYIVNDALIRISQETGLPLVFTKDYHYLNADEQDAHDTWVCIGRKLDKRGKDRLRYEGYPYHFATKEEMYESVKKGVIPQEAYDNTVKIAKKCNVDFDFKKNRFPKYKFTPRGHTADSYLRMITFHRLLRYAVEQKELNTPIVLEEYMKRLDYELNVISDKGYSDYFLILHDIFSYCRENKIPYGPGRGSGAGSLVAFLCGITGVDPIRHGLLFERFLNPERMSSPDIDFDICSERRPELFRYVYHHFGENHVAQIITYGGEKLRSAIDDLCRVLKETDENGNVIKYGQKLADEIKKTIPTKFPDQTEPTYTKMKALAENPEDFRRDFREKTDDLHKKAVKFMEYMKQYPDIDYYLRYIENLIRSYGQHAAAVVITSEEITEHIPVYNMKKEMPVTAFAMKEIDEDLNMLKLDALSLATMTVIQKALDLINEGKSENEHLVLSKLSLNDKETIRTIRQGHTVGVFQLSGNAITQYIKRAKPWDFDTIVDISAVYRPGPLEAIVDKDKYGNTTMAEKYIENGDPKELERFMEDIPPQLRHIYEKTRGILIYQEQIMALAQEMAGYTLGGADLLRRAIGKKIKELLQALKYEFIYGTEKGVELLEKEIAKLEAVEEDKRDKKAIDIYKKQLKEMEKALSEGKGVLGAVNKGYAEEYATKTFDAIERFAGYCFNKSHSVAYSLIAYYTAYLKTHYPVEFMTAQLTIDNAETEDILKNINECRRLGIPILPPDINKSSLGYSIEEIEVENEHGVKVKKKAIRYGMDSIKGIGEAVVQEIIKKPAHPDKTSQDGDPYTSFKDFYERVNKRVVNKGYIVKLIMAGCFDSFNPNRYEVLNEFYFDCRKSKKFEGTEKEFTKAKNKKQLKSNTELYRDPATFNVDVICKMEEEVIGFYLTHHPYEELPYEALDVVPDHKQVDIGGKIIKVKSHTMKNGKPMCFLTLDTIGGKVDVTLFNDTFEQYHEECFEGNIVIVRGKKQTRNDKPQIILSKLMKPRKKKFKVEKPKDAPVLIEKQEETSTPSEEVKTLEEDIFTQPRPNPTADLFSWVEEMEQETMKKDEPKKEVWEELANLFD